MALLTMATLVARQSRAFWEERKLRTPDWWGQLPLIPFRELCAEELSQAICLSIDISEIHISVELGPLGPADSTTHRASRRASCGASGSRQVLAPRVRRRHCARARAPRAQAHAHCDGSDRLPVDGCGQARAGGARCAGCARGRGSGQQSVRGRPAGRVAARKLSPEHHAARDAGQRILKLTLIPALT